ncbi:DNA alkylation repair protein [Candidatus Pacearchaeota archaeon CG_4_9_14_3_um_filter_30_11]|nr:MAG: DNA alkylation repair protein [Candidatus Pacearchaeota archaeon CG11_big_fil_rev_8_21_14_0_20_30_13]PJA71665.1 MAG: DNA alkylation repair protein [Candidatus Pacearchaeota archaeon CG_4_9_14_3_um_filter_30_11]
MLQKLTKEIQKSYSKERAEHSKRFFKTGVGEYGEGDIFLGLSVPEQRVLAKKYSNLSMPQIQKLLDSEIHEYRLIAGLILIKKFEKDPEVIFNFYIKNARRFNNWDLVDLTAPRIVGNFLKDKNKKIIYDLARSKNIWEKRIAIVSTLYFIVKENNFSDTLKISEIILGDSHDLIHKAVGWMLREVGKRNVEVLKDFLKINYKKIPRTALRYAIEKFPEAQRKKFLKGNFN